MERHKSSIESSEKHKVNIDEIHPPEYCSRCGREGEFAGRAMLSESRWDPHRGERVTVFYPHPGRVILIADEVVGGIICAGCITQAERQQLAASAATTREEFDDLAREEESER